jgi:hypothetical protein
VILDVLFPHLLFIKAEVLLLVLLLLLLLLVLRCIACCCKAVPAGGHAAPGLAAEEVNAAAPLAGGVGEPAGGAAAGGAVGASAKLLLPGEIRELRVMCCWMLAKVKRVTWSCSASKHRVRVWEMMALHACGVTHA